jgi:hypothetical protein
VISEELVPKLDMSEADVVRLIYWMSAVELELYRGDRTPSPERIDLRTLRRYHLFYEVLWPPLSRVAEVWPT